MVVIVERLILEFHKVLLNNTPKQTIVSLTIY